jgi:hypothetical protein
MRRMSRREREDRPMYVMLLLQMRLNLRDEGEDEQMDIEMMQKWKQSKEKE